MKYLYQESNHININLTNLAQKTIQTDLKIFEASCDGHWTQTQIINTIIRNYNGDFELNADLINLRDYGAYFKCYLNTDTINLINDEDYQKNFGSLDFNGTSQYIKCLLETYARQPFIEREKLILKNRVIEPILNALSRKKLLRITFDNKKFEVTPICIAPAKEGTFQYLVCVYDGKLWSFRLSRIQQLTAFGKAEPIPKNMRKEINEGLSEFGPTFVKEEPVTVKVRLSPKGIASYVYSVMHRPMHIDIEHCPDGKGAEDVFVFRCSEMQAQYFFFRFAGEAEILEPLSLREKFRNLYQSGLNNYIDKE